ncbi:FtsK/SpoIIIE domain-containing protein [Leucobacter chromiireducens]|uniref:FtsK domain-containing protein n=1 Tax=Leucobacter chromiireducens subsp. solipictus TaxID=398235 RepID=A0ABS1SG25_9MICO|nr:FtsK/SpoIIIE domain-containing protein [Leucobacter chromiireducens]MBL3679512.1 hypothetical protein [Leucobacter chromiireducens subsp. solipictus]
MRDMAVAQAKRSALRAIFNTLFTPIRWAAYLLAGVVTVLADSPRYEKVSGHRPRSSAQEARQIAGAALWAFLPSVASYFGAPQIFTIALTFVAVVLIGRRLRYLDQAAVTTRLTIPAFWQIPALLVPTLLAFTIALLPVIPATRNLLAQIGVPLTWWMPVAAIAIGGVLYWVALLISARHAGRGRARASEAAAMLRVACGVSDAEVAESLKFKAGSWSLSPSPMIARARLASDPAGVDAAVAAIMPLYEIVLDGRDLVIQEASLETADRRAQIAASDGLVIGQSRDGDVLSMTLAAGTAPSQAERVQAYARTILGAESALVEWEPYESRAVARVLSQDEQQVRQRLAQVLKIRYAWELAADVTSADGRIDQIVLRKLPPGLGGISLADRLTFWADVALSLPGGNNGWGVEEDTGGTITLTRGEPRRLPGLVPLADMLPAALAPDDWATIPVGHGETGQNAGFDLSLGPHALTVGPTGSGKTVALVAELAQRLVRGHRIAVIDPTKGGVDFAPFEPYTSGFARTFGDSVELIKAAYAEGQRRKQLLLTHGEVKWSDLPSDVREREGVTPLTVVIDEVGSLLVEPEIPRSLAKDDPERLELEELAGQKALLKLYIGKIARELRFVGIFLDLATQRPDASILGGELRSNLTSTAQLAKPGSPPTLDAIRMVFPGDSAQEAYDALRALDDGQSRGLGVIAGDGGGVAGVRVAYAPMREVVELLEQRGVPHGTPLLSVEQLVARESAAGRPQFGQIIEAAEEEIDLGEIDFGDLDLGDFTTASPDELPPVHAVEPAPTTYDTPAQAPQLEQPPVITSNRAKPNFDDLFG